MRGRRPASQETCRQPWSRAELAGRVSWEVSRRRGSLEDATAEASFAVTCHSRPPRPSRVSPVSSALRRTLALSCAASRAARLHSRPLAAGRRALRRCSGRRAAAVSLSEISVSATGVPTPIANTGSSVTVLTDRLLQEQQRRTVPDALQQVPGLNVVQTGGAGGQTSVFIRGTNSNHVKVQIDGIDVTTPRPRTAPSTSASCRPTTSRGSKCCAGPERLYGADAIGGVISVVTKRGEGQLGQWRRSKAARSAPSTSSATSPLGGDLRLLGVGRPHPAIRRAGHPVRAAAPRRTAADRLHRHQDGLDQARGATHRRVPPQLRPALLRQRLPRPGRRRLPVRAAAVPEPQRPAATDHEGRGRVDAGAGLPQRLRGELLEVRPLFAGPLDPLAPPTTHHLPRRADPVRLPRRLAGLTGNSSCLGHSARTSASRRPASTGPTATPPASPSFRRHPSRAPRWSPTSATTRTTSSAARPPFGWRRATSCPPPTPA